MCGPWCFKITEASLPYWPDRPRVLEVGSYNVNGSVRGIGEPRASYYLGVDINPGPGVDEIVNAMDLLTTFGAESFDVVLCTEMLEHVEDWPAIIRNLVGVLRVGGIIVLTTRDVGMYWHGFPGDYWRFSPDDLRLIFAPVCDVIRYEKDNDDQAWGSGIVARRVYQDADAWNQWAELLKHFPVHTVDKPRVSFNDYLNGAGR